MSGTDARRPEWLVERIAAGDGPVGAELTQAERAELERSDAEILAALPPAHVAHEIERRLRVERARRDAERRLRQRRGTTLGASLAAACAAVLVIALSLRDGPSEGPGGTRVAAVDPAEGNDGVRVKGDPRLVVHRRTGDTAVELRRDDDVWPGDQLQLSYLAAGRPRGMILSIDGRGAVTLHHPESADGDTALVQGKLTPLPHSYRLDDAPRFERFVFITTRTGDLDAGALLTDIERWAARPDAGPRQWRSAPVPLSPALEQNSFVVHKPETP